MSDAVLVVFGIRVSSPGLWDDPPMASDTATTDVRFPQTTSDLPVRSSPRHRRARHPKTSKPAMARPQRTTEGIATMSKTRPTV